MSHFIKQRTNSGEPAIIGQSMSIRGTIQSKQDLFFDGQIEGNLDVENCQLTIGPHGKVVANAKAREVEIQGILTGNIDCQENTSLRATARMVGDIKTRGIVIESGAELRGRVEIVTQHKQGAEARNGE